MTESSTEHRWLIGGLIAAGIVLLVAAAFVIGYAVGQDQATEPVTIGEQLEAWTSCLNEAGAGVPTVEARRDGGFSVTVSGSIVEDFDPTAMLLAFAQCQHLTPQFAGRLLESFMEHERPPVETRERQVPAEALEQLETLCERIAERPPRDLPEVLISICGLGEEESG